MVGWAEGNVWHKTSGQTVPQQPHRKNIAHNCMQCERPKKKSQNCDKYKPVARGSSFYDRGKSVFNDGFAGINTPWEHTASVCESICVILATKCNVAWDKPAAPKRKLPNLRLLSAGTFWGKENGHPICIFLYFVGIGQYRISTTARTDRVFNLETHSFADTKRLQKLTTACENWGQSLNFK